MGVSKLVPKLGDDEFILKSRETKIISIYTKKEIEDIIQKNKINDYLMIEY